MVDREKIKRLIKSCGLTQKEVAKRISISARSLNSKLNGKEFSIREMEALIQVLGIENPEEIFFAK